MGQCHALSASGAAARSCCVLILISTCSIYLSDPITHSKKLCRETDRAVIITYCIIMMSASLQLLSACHPLIIEGPGRHDTRDPASVARQLCSRLRSHWKQHPPQREVVLVTQGDPIEETGIAAITRHVASELGTDSDEAVKLIHEVEVGVSG